MSHDDIPPKEAAEIALLTAIATYNGLCRLITILGEAGILTQGDVDGLHDAMTTPLDDPDMRDHEVITTARETLERVLANTVANIVKG